MCNGGTLLEIDAQLTALQQAREAHHACLVEQQQIIDGYAGEIDLLLEERGALHRDDRCAGC